LRQAPRPEESRPQDGLRTQWLLEGGRLLSHGPVFWWSCIRVVRDLLTSSLRWGRSRSGTVSDFEPWSSLRIHHIPGLANFAILPPRLNVRSVATMRRHASLLAVAPRRRQLHSNSSVTEGQSLEEHLRGKPEFQYGGRRTTPNVRAVWAS